MAIEGRSLGEAARAFQDHLNDLLAHTITQTRVIAFVPQGAAVAHVGFRQSGKPTVASLKTTFGPLELFLLQKCGSIATGDGKHILITAEYKYTLAPAGREEPEIRWEYVRERGDPDARWARHHVQGPFMFTFGDELVSANDLHLATGFVTIEEVIRCLIVDFGVPPLSEDWHERLDASYERFKMEFAPGDPASGR